MFRKKLIINFLIVLFLGLCFKKSVFCGEFHYGPIGETKWDEQCQLGRQQSPIDLSIEDSIAATLESRRTYKGYDEDFPVTLVNNGHSLYVTPNQNGDIWMQNGGLPHDDTFFLLSVHFHWPSEHAINGERYPLEAHFVHFNSKYHTLENSTNEPDGLAVLGVLFNISSEDNEDLNPILELTEKLSTPKEPHNLEAFKLSPLMPNPEDYYLYYGSLTTPPCSESVRWTVFTETLPISENQLEKFKLLEILPNGPKIAYNARSLKQTGGRIVVFQNGTTKDEEQEKEENENTNRSSTISMNLFKFLLFGIFVKI